MRKKINPARLALVQNRIKQGLLAFFGSMAVLGATFVRVSSARNSSVDFNEAVKFSAQVSAGAGLVWSLFPRAADPLQQTVDALKSEVNVVTRMAMASALSDVRPPPATVAYEPRYPSYSMPRDSPSRALSTVVSSLEPKDSKTGIGLGLDDDSLYLPSWSGT